MDASKDSMSEAATFAYLMHGTVHGARSLTPEHMIQVIDKYVDIAKPQLRALALHPIGDQIVFKTASQLQLPEDFRKQRALKVFSVGEEMGLDEPVECWFIDRDGRWYWVRCGSQGESMDFSTVTVQHLVEARATADGDGVVALWVLSAICESFRKSFVLAAFRAKTNADDLSKATDLMFAGSADAHRFVTP